MNQQAADVNTEQVELDVESIAAAKYTGVLQHRIDVTDNLAIFQVVPDVGALPFEPGQYVSLGLGAWEARHPEATADPEELKPGKVVKRAYSISSPVFDEE